MTTFFFITTFLMLLWNLHLAAEKRHDDWRALAKRDRGPRVVP